MKHLICGILQAGDQDELFSSAEEIPFSLLFCIINKSRYICWRN